MVSFLIKTVDLWLKYDLNIMLAQVFSSEAKFLGTIFSKNTFPRLVLKVSWVQELCFLYGTAKRHLDNLTKIFTKKVSTFYTNF